MAARAGVPQIIVSHMADQFYWRTQLVKKGLGSYASNFNKLSVKGLSRAISACLADERYRENAKKVSEIINNTSGVEMTIKVIE